MVEQIAAGKIAVAACDVTRQGMEKREGHAIAIIPQATMLRSEGAPHPSPGARLELCATVIPFLRIRNRLAGITPRS
jgi:hypothetical protein